MTPLERDLLLKAIQNNPELLSSYAKGKALGGFTKQTLSGIGNMADDANRVMGGDQLVAAGVKALPKGLRAGAMGVVRSAPMRFAGRALPVLGAVQAVGDVGDIVLGDDSLGNKVMDTAAMGIGGTIGGVLGLGNPLLAAGGASLGKAASDGLQFLLGGGKSAEERKLEEALKVLQQQQGFNAGGALAGSIGGLPGALLGGMR
jgi:hypothetical protein